jgi:hypothetical protein
VAGPEKSSALYDNTAKNQLNGVLGISKTIFICILLTMASIYFNKDA